MFRSFFSRNSKSAVHLTKDIEILQKSPLFDPVWYSRTSLDLRGKPIDMARHYLEHGAREGRNPHPLFDTKFYLSQNSDVVAAGINPLVHYIEFGAKEGRNPHPLLDVKFYLAQNPAVVASGINPLIHYIERGAKEGRNPHPLFDAGFYLSENPDVAAAGVDPLTHYIESGAKQDRSPHPLFDPKSYLARNPEVAASGINPLVRYIESGAKEGWNPHPLFDVAFYLRQNLDVVASGMNPLMHYIKYGAREGRDPHSLFDTKFYREEISEAAARDIDPLTHYVARGAKEGRNPHPLFDARFYLSHNPEVAASGINPLVHYSLCGVNGGRDPQWRAVVAPTSRSFKRRENFLRIAIVTDEFVGLTASGGIGACARGLATVLAEAGHVVDVILTSQPVSNRFAQKELNRSGVRVDALADVYSTFNYADSDRPKKSYYAYDYLRNRAYDVVHFNDWLASGFYFAMAKRQGLTQSFIVTHCHGSQEWVREYNLNTPDREGLESEAMERWQIENSDLLVSPSSYMLEWYRQRGLTLPETKVMNWYLPFWLGDIADRADPLTTTALEPGFTEIIFFGRQERRKGFQLFIDAVSNEPGLEDVDLTFLGRFDRVDHEFTGSYALRRLARHKGALRFVSDLGGDDALKFIASRPNAVCVMPSLIENSPCVVGECFSLGIPFIASSGGGTAELLDCQSARTALFVSEPASLRAKLLEIRKRGLQPLQSKLVPTTIGRSWIELHEEKIANPATLRLGFRPLFDKASAAVPLVSACLVHYERPSLLRRAYEALTNQTYPNYEIVIVDDGSKSRAAIEELDRIEREETRIPVRVIRSDNRYLGAARNLAAANSLGKWIIFHDDDNIAEPHEIETFVASAENGGFDILTSFALTFYDHENPANGKISSFPIGIGGAFSILRNTFGDANCIIAKSVLDKMGGFTEHYGLGWEDWELFLRAHLSGFRIGVVPEPLFRYRMSATGMGTSTSLALNFGRIFDAAARYATQSFCRELLPLTAKDQIAQDGMNRTLSFLAHQIFDSGHKSLMQLEPNSNHAKTEFLVLLMKCGRYSDALEFGTLLLKNNVSPDRVSDILSKLGDRRGLYPIAPSTKSVSLRHECAVSMAGWLAEPIDEFAPGSVTIGGRSFEVMAYASVNRPDVNRLLDKHDEASRGFHIIARARDGFCGSSDKRLHMNHIDDGAIEIDFCFDQLPEKPRGHLDARIEGSYSRIDDLLQSGATYVGRVEIPSQGTNTFLHFGQRIVEPASPHGASLIFNFETGSAFGDFDAEANVAMGLFGLRGDDTIEITTFQRAKAEEAQDTEARCGE